MTRVDILNALIVKHGYRRYLEIGVQFGECYNAIKVDHKVGVDPDPACAKFPGVFVGISDNFFERVNYTDGCSKEWTHFDLVFIDGMHVYEQVLRDINNSLLHLSPNGTVVVHDMNPPDIDCADSNCNIGKSGGWCGDGWRAWLALRMSRPDLDMYTVDCDWGVGVIRLGVQQLYKPGYSYFDVNRQAILKLVSPEQFLWEIVP